MLERKTDAEVVEEMAAASLEMRDAMLACNVGKYFIATRRLLAASEEYKSRLRTKKHLTEQEKQLIIDGCNALRKEYRDLQRMVEEPN